MTEFDLNMVLNIVFKQVKCQNQNHKRCPQGAALCVEKDGSDWPGCAGPGFDLKTPADIGVIQDSDPTLDQCLIEVASRSSH